MFEGNLKRAFIFSLSFFFLFLIFGALAFSQNPESGKAMVETISQNVFLPILTDNSALLAINLFINNTEASVLLFIGGATFGIVTMFILMTNGIIVGFVLQFTMIEKGLPVVLAGIIPHGIFEIPAFITAAGLGFILSESIWREFRGRGDAAAEAGRLGKIFVMTVIPLLIAAAITEAFITPQIINLVSI
ncbi:stage II sporulation protein M [Methanoplanus endosymbiosus]|uniref:Stage II sporulation protein M n=1 Tax=Methanoplanus endosymbiosus TaxID=33865 RepID=A0A9E7PM99_9EURY|nr:stage II sporulation protein M [Methanoplanus endosymbiosus]UUX92810.1 stage II sporulation protein M [Methanoplanus endosymbiosus]